MGAEHPAAWDRVRVRRLHTQTSLWLGLVVRAERVDVYTRSSTGAWVRSTVDREVNDPRLDQLFEWLCSIGEEAELTEVEGTWGAGGPVLLTDVPPRPV